MLNPSKAVRSALMVAKGLAKGGRAKTNPNFDNWFGGSKVVDEKGKPLVVYHGTPHGERWADKNAAFSVNPDVRRTDQGNFGHGIYMTPHQYAAKAYSRPNKPNPNDIGTVLPLYASIKNPLRIPVTGPEYTDHVTNLARSMGVTAQPEWRGSGQHNPDFSSQFRERALAHGYDGVITHNDDGSMGSEVVAYNPTQVKHATDNTGEFNPADPRITRAAGGSLSDAINSFSKDREAQFNRPSSGNSDAALLASLQQHPQLAVAEPPERPRQSMSQGANDLGAQIDEGARWLSGTQDNGTPAAVKGSAKTAPSSTSGAGQAGTPPAHPGGPSASNINQNDAAMHMMDRLVTVHGWTPAAAAIAAGNAMQESGFKPSVAGDASIPGGSHGYAQWNRDRFANLQGFAKQQGTSWTDPDTQIDFLANEAKDRVPGWSSQTDLSQARPISKAYEGYGVEGNRVPDATKFYDMYQNRPQPQQAQAPQPAPAPPVTPPPVQPRPVTPDPQAQADPLGNLYNKVANSPSVASGYGNPQAMFDPDTPQAKRGGQIRRASGGGIAVMPTNDLIQLALDRINRQRFASGGMSHSDVHRIAREHFDGGGSGGDGGDGGGSSGDGGDGGGGDGDGGDSGDSGDSGDTGFGTSGVGTAGASVGFGSAGDSSGVGGVGDAGAPAGTSSNSGMAGFAGIGGGDSGDAGVGGPSATGSSVGFAGSPGTSSTGVGSGPGSATGVSGPGAPGAATGVGTAGVGPGTAATGNAAAASTAAGFGAHGAGSFGGAGGPGFGAFGSAMGFGLGQSGAGDPAASNSDTATVAKLASTPMRYGFVKGNDPGMMAANSVQGLFGTNTSPSPTPAPTPAPTSPLSPSVVAQLNAQMGGAPSATAAPAAAPAPAPASPSPAAPSPAAPIGFGNVGFGGSSSSPGTGVTGFNSNPAGNAASVSTTSLASPATPAAPIAFADGPSPATSPASPVSAVSNIGTPNSPLGLTSPTPAPTTTPSPTISPAVQMGAGSGEQNVGSFPSAAKPATAAQPASPAATPNFAPAIPSGVVGNHGGYGNVTGAAPNYNGSYNSTLDQALGTNSPTADQIFGFTYPTPPPSKAQPQGPISQAQINALSGQGSQVFASGGAIIMDAALNKARKAIKRNKRYV